MTAPDPRPSVPPTTCEKCGFVLMASDTLAGPYCVNPKCSRRGAVILPPLDIRVRVIPSAAISIPAAASEEQDVSFKSHSPDVSFKSLSEEPPATSTPPEKCLRCNGAGFVGGNPYPCPRCNGIGFEYSAPPSASPEPPPTISQLSASRELIPAEEPPELKEALDRLEEASQGYGELRVGDPTEPSAREEILAARAAVVALFDRQREEIERYRSARNRSDEQIASLQSQLERLKAEQLTAVEAQSVLNDIPFSAWDCAHGFAMDSAIEKLRRLSQSEESK